MNITIIFSTQMGTTQMAATQMQNVLSKMQHSVSVVHANDLDMTMFDSADLLIIATPTYDDGQPEQSIVNILPNIASASSKKTVASVVLGDSAYPNFCTADEPISKAYATGGHNEVVPPLKIDNYMYAMAKANEDIQNWLHNLLAVVSTASD